MPGPDAELYYAIQMLTAPVIDDMSAIHTSRLPTRRAPPVPPHALTSAPSHTSPRCPTV